jgi:hypothetical protein
VSRQDVPDFSSDDLKKSWTPIDLELAERARRQHGIVTVGQLRACGLSDPAIAHRVRAGRLHRLHRGVYGLGHAALSGRGRLLAAVLAVGPDAVLSHRSAAVLWELVKTGPSPVVDVTVPRAARSRRGIRVHVTRRLSVQDRCRGDGIPVTTVARTLLDLADVADPGVLRRAVREAYVRRRVDEPELRAMLERARGHHGAPRLLALVTPGLVGTRSELEDRLLDLLVASGLPRPLVNARLDGLPRPVEADFLFVDAAVIVEADGARYHDNRITRDADVARQAMLEAAGYRVLRVNWKQVTTQPDETARRLRRALTPGLPSTP